MKIGLGASTLVLAAFAMGGSGLAADMRVPTKAPVYKAAPPSCGWYWSGFGGWNSAEDFSGLIPAPFDGARSVSFKDGYVVGGAIGRCVPGWNWLRIEGEISYRRNNVDSLTVAGEGTASRSGHISALALMANAWADFNIAPNVTLHAGGGIGVARVSLNVSNVSISLLGPFPIDDSDTVFAFQLGAGGAWHFNPNLSLTLDYRYFQAVNPTFNGAAFGATYSFRDEYQSHSIMLGLRGRLGGGP